MIAQVAHTRLQLEIGGLPHPTSEAARPAVATAQQGAGITFERIGQL
jgi:hypothetical protein